MFNYDRRYLVSPSGDSISDKRSSQAVVPVPRVESALA